MATTNVWIEVLPAIKLIDPVTKKPVKTIKLDDNERPMTEIVPEGETYVAANGQLVTSDGKARRALLTERDPITMSEWLYLVSLACHPTWKKPKNLYSAADIIEAFKEENLVVGADGRSYAKLHHNDWDTLRKALEEPKFEGQDGKEHDGFGGPWSQGAMTQFVSFMRAIDAPAKDDPAQKANGAKAQTAVSEAAAS